MNTKYSLFLLFVFTWSCRYIVGLAGPPGAGKTTIASEVVQRLNKLWPQKASSMDSQVNPADVAAVLPMDGFHLYRSQLDSMEVSYTSIFPESPWLFCLNNFHMIRKPSDFFFNL